MQELHPYQVQLLKGISLEMREQEQRYKLGSEGGIKQLRAEGVLLQPINVNRKSFGYADYPEITFRLPFPMETAQFRDNSPIECFIEGEEAVKGILLGIDGKGGTFRLFAPDFPDWIEERGVGIKLTPDPYTGELMQQAIENLNDNPRLFALFQEIHGPFNVNEGTRANSHTEEDQSVVFGGEQSRLNPSQRAAVDGIVMNENMLIVHGPPGTGKTTTLVEGIAQLIRQGKRILVSAPSNAAVDHIARGLVKRGIKILRVGNSLKVDAKVFPFTNEGQMLAAKEHKEIKRLKIQAEEYRRMAAQYKRHFGKEEREQRVLLMREVKSIRTQIKNLKKYFDDKLVEHANVILSTPVGLYNFLDKGVQFDVLIIDEAGQLLEPLAWLIFPFAKSWILAGDPFQLAPTVLSKEAEKEGFAVSILEHAFGNSSAKYFLDTQYRMRASIAGFSSTYFYHNSLLTPPALADKGTHITFFDTAGTGFEEQSGRDGTSLLNEGELDLIRKVIVSEELDLNKMAIISPYAGQVQYAREELSEELRISTIDSFQGQEHEIILLSLVRSNAENSIGFLADYRRMNVALTRAKEQLFVIGDSSTIGTDPFYAAFLDYMEKVGEYRSAWELMG